LRSSGRLPKPVNIGGSVRWRASDIEKWIDWGCPDRKTFEARKEVR
jgi:predicted DNA-binding transcriptional regulator AlpA